MTSPAATPRILGFRMPAEWARHDATWLTWPRPEGISFPDAFDDIPALWAGLAKLLAEGADELPSGVVDDDGHVVAGRARRPVPIRRSRRIGSFRSHCVNHATF